MTFFLSILLNTNSIAQAKKTITAVRISGKSYLIYTKNAGKDLAKQYFKNDSLIYDTTIQGTYVAILYGDMLPDSNIWINRKTQIIQENLSNFAQADNQIYAYTKDSIVTKGYNRYMDVDVIGRDFNVKYTNLKANIFYSGGERVFINIDKDTVSWTTYRLKITNDYYFIIGKFLYKIELPPTYKPYVDWFYSHWFLVKERL